MLFAMTIDKSDYNAVTDVHTIIGDFYAATRHHIAKNPELQAVINNLENTTLSDTKMHTTISNMKHLLSERLMSEEFSYLEPEQQAATLKEIEMQCSVVEAQQFDHFIGVMERFVPRNMMAAHLLPSKAKDYPLAFATTMEKYGLKRTANVIYHHLAMKQG